jgi:hypothetical protein
MFISSASFSVKDINGVLRPVKRYEVWEAQETLGIYLAPDGNTKAQFNKMLQTVIQWSDNMRTGRISKRETWLAFISTIWRTLCYPLPAINFTRKQCDKLMAPLLSYVLPALGICRNFPRNLVFAPHKYMGLGIKHIHTTQEITRLKDILYHACTSLACLILEIGLDFPLHQISFTKFGHLVTSSLVKSTWEFIHLHNIELRHDLYPREQRQGDVSILWVLLSLRPSKEHLSSITRCRLFLKVFWVSDITDGSGLYLLDEAWRGQPLHSHRIPSWPRQGKPTTPDWEIWRRYLSKGLLGRGRRLKHPLGSWYPQSDNPWRYCQQEDALYHVTDSDCIRYLRSPRRSGRPMFSNIGSIAEPQQQWSKASVCVKGQHITLTGYGPCLPTTQISNNSFAGHLQSLASLPGYWSLRSIQLPPNCSVLASELINGTIIAVSDGSYSETFGSAAWVLQGVHMRCTGQVVCPGSAREQNSYRSEVAGLLSILIMVDQCVQYYNISEGSIEVACDGESALNKIFSCMYLLHINDPCYDLLFVAQLLHRRSPLSWCTRHVKGHQDESLQMDTLDIYARLNIEMDTMAKSFLQRAKVTNRHFTTIHELWALWIDGCISFSHQKCTPIHYLNYIGSHQKYSVFFKQISSKPLDKVNKKIELLLKHNNSFI